MEFVDTIRKKVGMARSHRSRNGGDVVDATVAPETGFPNTLS